MVRRGWLVSPSQHSVYFQSDVHQARANHRRGQSQVINETSALPLPSNRKARSRRWSVSCRRSPLLSPLLYHGPPLIEFTRPGWVALPESLFIQSPLTTTRCSVSDFRERNNIKIYESFCMLFHSRRCNAGVECGLFIIKKIALLLLYLT